MLFGLLTIAFGFDVPVSGTITDASGAALTGSRSATFRLFADADSNGSTETEVYTATLTVAFIDGAFQAILDPSLAVFDRSDAMALSVEVDGLPATAAAPVGWAPRAIYAETAAKLGSITPDQVFLNTDVLPSSGFAGAYAQAVTLSNAGNSFIGSGAGLTGLSASNLANGTVPDARLSGTYSGALTLSNVANSLAGSGAAITALNASNLASGTVPDARLSGTYSGTLTLSNAANAYTGNGGGLTNLNAGNLGSGTVAAARLPASVVRTDLTTTQTFAGPLAMHGDPTTLDGRYFGEYFHRGFAVPIGSLSYVNINDAPVGVEVATTSGYTWTYGPRLPLDVARTYEVELSMRWTGTGSPAYWYMSVQEYDAAGNNITGDGNDWWYPVSSAVPANNTWQRYRFYVGPNGGKAHAPNARYISVGFIANYTNGTGVYQFTGARIRPSAKECPTGSTRLGGIWCLENTAIRAAAPLATAIADCGDEGMEICPMIALAHCDMIEPAGVGCTTATDTVAATMWVPESRSAVGTDLFANWGLYRGDNIVTSTSTSNSHGYFCCSRAGR